MSQDKSHSKVVTLTCGTVPLLVSMPHVGTHIPQALQAQYAPQDTAFATPHSSFSPAHRVLFSFLYSYDSIGRRKKKTLKSVHRKIISLS